MTAVDVRPVRRSLSDQLGFLVGELAKLPGSPLGRAFALQLAAAADKAEVQALEIEMLRGEAADRERARDGLQSARRDLQALVDVVDGLDAAVLSKSWLVERLMGSARRIDSSLNSEERKTADV